MPKNISASTDQTDITLTTVVPQDTESIDASDVVVPFQALLNNDGFLYRRQNALYDQLAALAQTQASFQLLSNLTSLNLEPSRTYTFPSALRISRFGGLTGGVTLTALNAPAGVTVTATPNPITDVADLTINTSAGVIAGNYDLILRGTAATAMTDIRLPLNISGATLPASFDLTGPDSVAIDRPTGPSTTASVNVQRAGGFNNPIVFTADAPAGVSAVFSTTPVTGADSVQRAATILTLTAAPTVPVGTYNITVRGVSGAIVRTLALSLNVSEPAPVAGTPSYALRVVYDDGDPYVVNGATIYIDRSGGFAGPVQLTIGGQVALDGPIVVINKSLGLVTVTGTAVRVTVDGLSRGWTGSGIAPLPAGGGAVGNWQQLLLSAYAFDAPSPYVFGTVQLRRGNRRVDLVAV